MNKKICILIILIIAIVLIAFFLWNYLSSKKQDAQLNKRNQRISETTDYKVTNSKVAIVYFSVTGNTAEVAQYIAEETGGKLIEIEPEDEYTEEDIDYNNSNSRTSKEQNDSTARPRIKNDIDIESDDTIFLGYPIWLGEAPRIILTLIDNNDLSGKKVIPFCTSGGSGIETSIEELKNYNKDIHWQEGKRLSTSKKAVTTWLKDLKY